MKLLPIETAPKDGTYILLFGDSGYTTTPLRCCVGRWDAEYKPLSPWVTYSDDSFEDSGEPPIFWLPLPEIPKLVMKGGIMVNMKKAFQEVYEVCKDMWQIATDYTWNEFKKEICQDKPKLINCIETPLDVVHLVINCTALGYETGKSAQQYYEMNKDKVTLSQDKMNLMYEIFDRLTLKGDNNDYSKV